VKLNNLGKVVVEDHDGVQVSSLVDFLTSMAGGEVVLRGKSIEATGLSSRRVMFLLRKFLYVNHLSGHGVLDIGGSFEIFRIKPETKEEAEEHETLKPTRGPSRLRASSQIGSIVPNRNPPRP